MHTEAQWLEYNVNNVKARFMIPCRLVAIHSQRLNMGSVPASCMSVLVNIVEKSMINITDLGEKSETK